MRRRGQLGFTLIELLIVVAIIGIVAAISIPQLLRARMAGNEASAIASLRVINSSQNAFAQSCGNGLYATMLSDLMIAPNGGAPYISPDLGAGAPDVIKSGYTIEMNRGSDATAGTSAACNGVTAAALGSSFYAFADPVVSGNTGSRYFWTNALGAIYFANSSTLSGETAGSSAPSAGATLQ